MKQLAPSPSQQGCPQHGLMSLWDMFAFDAEDFCIEFGYLHALAFCMEMSKNKPEDKTPSETKEHMRERLENVKGKFSNFGVPATIAQIDRLINYLKHDDVREFKVASMFSEIQSRFIDELSGREFYVLAQHKVAQMHYLEHSILESVVSNFPSCMEDLDEALSCYALDKHTACVFHIMRVLEVPIQVLANKLLPNDPKPNWDPLLRKIDAELKLPYKDRAIKGDEKFYAEVSAHMHAVKLAWRNPVMHISGAVSESRAKAVLEAVIALMNHLSLELSENGEVSAS